MDHPQRIRVAALQFATTDDRTENLATCLRMIDAAAIEAPHLIVLPEFCNHLPWYRDRHHAYDVAVQIDGDFLSAIAARAVQHDCYIMANCTIRRPHKVVTSTNILYDPNGKRVALANKQVMLGNEAYYLERARYNSRVVNLPFARIGMYADADGVLNETPRGLALRGAQLLLSSNSSFARDASVLHTPVRAAENKVFVVAANKVGPLAPPDIMEMLVNELGIHEEQLTASGMSQIVGPDGQVLAQGPAEGEAVIVTDLEPTRADDKRRPDGTDIFEARRPNLYMPIGEKPAGRDYLPGANAMRVGTYLVAANGPSAVKELVDQLPNIAREGVELLVLPELFHVPDGQVSNVPAALQASRATVRAIQRTLNAMGDAMLVATSVVEKLDQGVAHVGVLISNRGVVLRQPQLHASLRHPWITQLGQDVRFRDLPWGRFAMVVGNDAIFPETFRLVALKNAEVVAVPTHVLEAWELQTGLLERAAENRLSIVAGSRRTPAGGGIVITNQFRRPAFMGGESDGWLNYPSVTRAGKEPGLTTAQIFPAASEGRTLTPYADVVASRPWWLAEHITETPFDGLAPVIKRWNR